MLSPVSLLRPFPRIPSLRRWPLMAAALALALAPGVGRADTGRLSDMLRMIPAEAVPQGAPRLDIVYGNGDAVRNVARNGMPAFPAHDWAHEFAARRAAPPAQAAALEAGEGEALSLAYRDWVHALEVSADPARMGIHFLFPDSEMRLRGALFASGLGTEMRGSRMVLWRGAEDHRPDPARADVTDPFGGADGLPGRFNVEGQWALWATGWPQIDAMMRGGFPTLADRAEVSGAVSALSGAVRRYGRLVTVRLSLDETGAGLEEFGGAPVTGLMLADVVDRRDEAALIGFLFAPGTDVAAYEAAILAAWPGTMLARWGSAPDVIGIGGAQPGFFLAVDGDWGADEAAENAAFASFVRALENGTFAALLSP